MKKTRTYIFSLLLTALMVTACSLEGDIDEVLEKAGLRDNNKPNTSAAPSGVTARAVSSSSITISWSYGHDWYSFGVYRSSSASGSYSYIGMAYTTTYTDTGLSANTTYYYKVSANNSNGESPKSSHASATTNSSSNSGAPGAPSGVYAQAFSSNEIYISWNWVSGAEFYYVYRSSSASGYYTFIGFADSAYFYDDGVSANTTYYYKVSAVSSYGESSQSSYASAKTY